MSTIVWFILLEIEKCDEFMEKIVFMWFQIGF